MDTPKEVVEVVDDDPPQESDTQPIAPEESCSPRADDPLLKIPSESEQYALQNASDSDTEFQRAILDETDSDVESTRSQVSQVIPQTQPARESFAPSTTHGLRPEDIELPDLLKWVARNSSFTAVSPPSDTDDCVLMDSEPPPPPRGGEFVTLTASPAIQALAAKRASEASDRDKHPGPTIGKIPVSSVCKVPMKQYTLGSEGIRSTPPLWPADRPDWLLKVKPTSRLYVTDGDVVRLDSATREILTILSNMDGLNAAVQRTVNSDFSDSLPFILRALRAMGSSLGDLARLAVGISHQLTLHRRDAALWEAKSHHLTGRQVTTLRHAPFLAAVNLFDEEALLKISTERQEDAQKQAILRVATTPVKQASPSKSTQQKRSPPVASPTSSMKKARKNSPQKVASASAGSASQQTSSTSTASTARSHR